MPTRIVSMLTKLGQRNHEVRENRRPYDSFDNRQREPCPIACRGTLWQAEGLPVPTAFPSCERHRSLRAPLAQQLALAPYRPRPRGTAATSTAGAKGSLPLALRGCGTRERTQVGCALGQELGKKLRTRLP
jgi:hypothetical protein